MMTYAARIIEKSDDVMEYIYFFDLPFISILIANEKDNNLVLRTTSSSVA